MKKILCLITMFLLLCPVVFADGMIHIYDKDMWNLQPENQQLVAINYQDGFENMLISIDINYNVQGEKAVWIFPVPASPDKVVIDILKGFPRLLGQDMDSVYEGAAQGMLITMSAYSLFPISVLILPVVLFRMIGMAGSSVSGDVVVYDRIEKMGLTTELITTKNSEALAKYLQDKGLDLPEQSTSAMNYYVGKDYSFVISYISNLTQFKQQAQMADADYYGYRGRSQVMPIGVFVKFPTEKIYFPLKPTSVYGNYEIPVLLYVIGHVTPELYPEIQSNSEITYYSDTFYSPEANLSTFFNGKSKFNNLEYTKIKITAPSKSFVADLWIKNSAPSSVRIKQFFVTYILLWWIILFIIFSMIASVWSGMIAFRKEPVAKKKLLINGLWNCLTWIGFNLGTNETMKTKEVDPKILQELKEKGLAVNVRDSRKTLYKFLFYVFFVALSVALYLFLRIIG